MSDIVWEIANQQTIADLKIGEDEDLRFPVTRLRRGANLKPDFNEGEIALEFPENDETEIVYIIAQMPHSRVTNSDIEPHIHFRQNQANSPTFVMEYKWYNPNGDTIPTTWETYVMDVPTNTSWTAGTISNMLYGSAPIDGNNKEKSSMMLIKLYRQTGDGYSGDCLVDEFDIHYKNDKFGLDEPE